MGNENKARILILSAVHGSTNLDICVGYGYTVQSTQVDIRGEGVVGPSAMGETHATLQAFVDYLVGTPIARNTTGSLVFTAKDTDGTSHTVTLATMKALGQSGQFNREAAPGTFRQDYAHVGDFAASPVSHAEL